MNKQLVQITSTRNFAGLFDALVVHAVLILVKLLTLPQLPVNDNDMQLSGRRWRSKSYKVLF